MYFDAAEAALADLDSRTTALESATGPDLAPVLADVETLKVAVNALNGALGQVTTTLTTLDARLDAIASGAQG